MRVSGAVRRHPGGTPTATLVCLVFCLVFCLVCLAFVPAPAIADGTPWDQAAVTRLAEEPSHTTERLYTEFYEQSQTMEMPVGAGDSDRFKDRIRLMRSEAAELAKQLEAGKGRSQTRPVLERLRELNDDARELAREQFTTGPVDEGFAGVERLLEQIRAYYD